MNLEELKNSDLLDLYLMGQLPEDKSLEVEMLLEKYPELLLETNDSKDALAMYGAEYNTAPRPELKSKVMGAISALNNETVSEVKAERAPQKSNSFNWYSIAASVLLLVTVGLTYTLVQKNARIDELSNKLAANETQLAENNTQFSSMRETLDALYENNVQQVKLKSTDPAKNTFATFFYNKATHKVMIHQGNLEKRTDDMQYQVWALIDGKPYSAGVFDAETSADSLKIITTDLNP
ncbi:MAG: anti-sigma factor, partial [Bacteroidota bacterium]